MVNQTGVIGGSAKIRIRGTGSINASNDPVVYVDGVRVQSGTQAPAALALRQTSPGRYEGRAIVDADQSIAAVADADAADVADGSVTSALFVPDAHAESRPRAADARALGAIAQSTHGAVIGAPEDAARQIGDIANDHRATRRPLWPLLLWSALALWIGDVFLRRIRF